MLDLEARFSPKIIPASAEYPYGKLKPNTTPTNNDGTPVAADTGNDIEGFKQAAITRANIDPSGVPDNAVNSQLLDSLDKRYLKITYQPWTFMDGGVLTDCSQAVKHSNGEYYSWTGVFPEGGKVVAAGTDPTVDSLYVSRVTNLEHLHVVGTPSTDNTGTTYVQDLVFDTYGHVTGLVSTEIREGNTSQTGIVQLTDSTSSTSTTTAATPNSVKNAYDLASAAIPSAQKGSVGGVATLDGSGKVPTAQLPSASEIGAVPATRTVNSKPLSGDVTITASDVNAAPSSHVGATGDAHGVATTSVAGFMSAADKTKLDSMGSGGDYTHPASGVTAGTYKSVTVDINGHVTSGTNPTTLSGYGITDAVLSSDVVTTATASKILKLDANSKLPASITGNADGNAATATKLATARTINGVSFDGSANITINAVDSTSRIASNEKGIANGVATLGSDGKISSSQLPSYIDDVLEYTNIAAFPTTGEAGKIYVALDTNKTYRWSGSAYVYITSGAVDSVAGKTGVVTLVKADVGLSDVDNTSDINKPISTEQQSALNLKADLASPVLTGAPSAPTATVGTSTTQIATTAFVNAEIANDAAPSSHVGATGDAHGVATTSVAGFMSAADKTKLDSMGSGGDYTHPASGVTAGTYKSVTVDANGHITAGSNPTTLAGYGITDAQALDADLTAIAALSDTSGLLKKTAANTWSLDTNTYITENQNIVVSGDASGSGTTSIALTLANSGATAGTYKSVTVDAKGRVTAGTNPTTLAGYNITDAAPSTHVGSTGSAHGVATTSVAGFMSATDKTKLDGISGANTGDQTITLTGDVTGSGTGSFATTLANSGVTTGTYKSVTVDAKGRVTAGTNPTTLAGYGITDATPSSHIGSVGTEHGVVTTSVNGFMSAADKTKLDGIAAGANAYTHPASGVTAGTYKSVTVDAKGHVTAGANPTTLAGYGITDAVSTASRGVANGIATLDASGLVPTSQLPSYVDDVLEYANLGALPVTGEAGKIYVTSDNNKIFRWSGSAYIEINSGTGNSDSAMKLTTARTISTTGDATWSVSFDGSANVSSAITLANSGASAGTYNNTATSITPFTIDAKGRVTGTGTDVTITPAWSSITEKPTTLSGYGITDAATASHTHTIIGFSDTRSENFNPTSYQGLSLHLKGNTTDGLDDGGGYHGVLNLMQWNDYSGGHAHQLGFTDNGNMHIRSTADGTTFSSWGKVWTSLNDGAGSGLDADLLDGLSSASTNTASTVVTRDSSGNFSAGTITAALSGNASTATTLQTARTIATSGDATGTATSFDGSANITIPLTLANTGVTDGTYTKVTVDAKGRVTTGTNPTTLAGYGITDAAPSSHIGSTGTAHGLATTSVAGFMSAADKTKLDGLGSGGAATNADRLTTPRLINGTYFDGTSNISTAYWGASRTITIGGTSKTVSGGSDVSWSTSELGCLPLTGGALSGPLSAQGSLSAQGAIYVGVAGYPQNYCSLQVDSNRATIKSSPSLTNGFKIMNGSSTYFLVDESGEVFAQGVNRVYHTNNKPTATDVGLGNVNNTSDLNKPISTATQAALDGKSATTHTHTAADVGALSTSGTAAAATKLATARTIAGKSFDGTANISIAASDVGALSTSGGTLSGDLNTSGAIKLTNTSSLGLLNSFGRTIIRGSSVATNVFGNTTDAMYFDGNSLTAWQVRYNSTLYPIYHTGNKPTPAEIGAQPATSDSRVKSNITSLPPVLDKIMLIDPKTFTMEGREGTCVGTIAQDWEVDFPEVILNVPSTSQGEPEMLKGIDALGTIGILLKAIQELKAEIEELKNR